MPVRNIRWYRQNFHDIPLGHHIPLGPRGGQGACPVLDRALGRCSCLRCNWWKEINGQGHSWLKVLHLDWNIPRGLEVLRVFVLVHSKDV